MNKEFNFGYGIFSKFMYSVKVIICLQHSMNWVIFLRCIFAPIAFFWLILGYIQQGKQLDQNTKALEQQEKAFNFRLMR
jgi:hypothetical protein